MNHESSKKKLKNNSQNLTSKKSILHAFSDKSRGFTIVELLVTMSIMAVAFGLVTVNYRDFQRAKQLENARREIITAARRAQQLASSGTQPNDCIVLIEVRFVINASQDGYRYEAWCDNDGDGFGETPLVYADYPLGFWKTLPEGVDVTTGGTARFNNAVKGGISNASDLVINLENSSGDSETITIYRPSGRIE